MFKLPLRPTNHTLTTTLRSMSLLSTLFGVTSTTTTNTNMSDPQSPPTYPTRHYTPSNPTSPFPYTATDLTPMDPGNDNQFYAPPRFVTHIDDGAIIGLKRYYDSVLPRRGVILDFCSSWISHYPPSVYNAARKREEHRSKREKREDVNVDGGGSASQEGQAQGEEQGDLIVLGTGMNNAELSANPVLTTFSVENLNENPDVSLPRDQNLQLDASTCVVSIDYLTDPVAVLSSIRAQTVRGGTVHLAISNRCFPTKVVGRWLKVSESERLEMVGDYLWWSGWREIEIVEVVKGGWMGDPLWVVRGVNEGGEEGSK